MSELMPLRAETLHAVEGGRVGAAINLALARLVTDCRDRPGDDRARTVTIEIRCKPVADTIDRELVCDGVQTVVVVKTKAPAQESREVVMGVDARRGLVFNPHSPDARQASFLGYDEE